LIASRSDLISEQNNTARRTLEMGEQKIPWARISAAAAAIVVSILLAFVIDASLQHRGGEVAEEREILVGLEAEFVDLRERLEWWADMSREGSRLITAFLSGGAAQMSREELESVFVYSMLANVLDQRGALDALLASGRLERISDRDIRVRLAKWPDWLEGIHTNDLSIRNFAFRKDCDGPRHPVWRMKSG
jgi:hypothetical protein